MPRVIGLNAMSPVPDREVQSDAQTGGPKRIDVLLDDVARVATLGDTVSRQPRRPETESVVVLSCQNAVGHASSDCRCRPLLTIDDRRRKKARALMRKSPLFAGERSDAEAIEHAETHVDEGREPLLRRRGERILAHLHRHTPWLRIDTRSLSGRAYAEERSREARGVPQRPRAL